ACRPGASLRARVSSSSRTLIGLRSMKAIECFTETSTSPRFSQPAGGLEATLTAAAPGAMCTQVHADSARARETVRILRIGTYLAGNGGTRQRIVPGSAARFRLRRQA